MFSLSGIYEYMNREATEHERKFQIEAKQE